MLPCVLRHAPRLALRARAAAAAAARGASSSAPGATSGATSYSYPTRSLCKAVVIGRTGKAPSLHEFDDGSARLTFSVATTRERVSVSDAGVRDQVSTTQWNRIVLSSNVPGFEFYKSVEPGTLVYVEGALKTRQSNDPDRPFSEFTNVLVTRSHGVFRLLARSPKSSEATGDGGEGPPF